MAECHDRTEQQLVARELDAEPYDRAELNDGRESRAEQQAEFDDQRYAGKDKWCQVPEKLR